MIGKGRRKSRGGLQGYQEGAARARTARRPGKTPPLGVCQTPSGCQDLGARSSHAPVCPTAPHVRAEDQRRLLICELDPSRNVDGETGEHCSGHSGTGWGTACGWHRFAGDSSACSVVWVGIKVELSRQRPRVQANS